MVLDKANWKRSASDILRLLNRYDDFNKANGYVEAYIKDDLGTISIVVECHDSELKEEMYLALKPYHPN